MKTKFSTKTPFIQFLLALAIFYLILIFFFNKVIFQPNNLSLSPDFLSGKILVDASKGLSEQGPPLWSPYFFGGMPCTASLQNPLHTYTFFNSPITEGFIGLFFLNPGMEENLKLMLFHIFMAGAFAYLFARTFGLSWIASVFAGVVYMFTPQLIVLPGVGHGSKVFTIAYIPLILTTVKRMMDKQNLLNFALFVLSVGMTLLSIHVQMAYYALLAGGMYMVWSCIFDIKGKLLKIPVKAGLFFGGVLLGIGFAAASYLPVYEYTPYSIRGAAEGGLNWDYATAWSFHPLESLTYFIPSFFGFGGRTYWGYMPFTDMPLYWGAAAFTLAVIAIALNRNRKVTFFIILLLFAWVLSFGKFLPILFKPMFELMPYFDKFRVPVMIQILMALSVSALAGFGLDKLQELSGKTKAVKGVLYGLIGVAGAAVLLSVLYSPFKSMISDWITAQRPQIPTEAHPQLFSMLFGDLWKTAFFAGGTLAAAYFFMKKKIVFPVFGVIVILLLVIDLWTVNTKLVHYQPKTMLSGYLQATPTVNYLQKQQKPFRIFPLDNLRPQNWYGHFGLESIDGYMGTKMKLYQELLDSVGLDNFSVINMFNTEYVLTDKDLSGIPGMVMMFDGGQQKVFRNFNAMPRAWVVHKTVCLPNSADKYEYIKRFNPADEAVTEEDVNIPAGEGGSAQITEYKPLQTVIKTSSPTEAFLVQSEIYYPPYWKAYIDGKETRIYQTDHLLRGVIIPAGEHNVEFKCESSMYTLGWTIHYIIFALTALVLLWYAYKYYRRVK